MTADGVAAGDLLEYAARRAGPAATGDAIAAAVGLARHELVALVTARRPIAVDVAAQVAARAGVDPADIWPDWATAAASARSVTDLIDDAAVAVLDYETRPRGAPLFVAVHRYAGAWRVDAYRRNGDPVDHEEWDRPTRRYRTADEAEAAARAVYGPRIARLHRPARTP
jgi:hypothetical protein